MDFRNIFVMKVPYNNDNDYVCVHLSPTSSHLHPLQVESCDRNTRLVVDEDDNG